MSFIVHVQRGKVSAPIHRSYSENAWDSAYKDLRASVDCDRVHEAGKHIYSVLELLRKINSEIPKWVCAADNIKYLVGLCNKDALVLAKKLREGFFEAKPKFMNDLEHFKVRLETGQMATPDEIGTSNIDSLSTVLVDVLLNSDDVSAMPLTDEEKLTCLAAQLNICTIYQWVESIWQDCLWNKYAFVDDGEFGYYVQPEDGVGDEIARLTAATSYRKKMFQNNLTGLLAQIWQHQFSDFTKARLSTFRYVKEIQRKKKTKEIILSTANSGDERNDQVRFEAFVAKDVIQKEFYENILATSSSKIGGKNVENLFDVWLVLRSLSRASSSRISDAFVKKPQTLLDFLSAFSRKSLTGLIQRATNLSVNEIVPILEFLTFRGKRGQTLWTQPLIETEKDEFIMPFAALHQAEPLFVLECWLPMLKIDVSAKGGPFEREIREALRTTEKSDIVRPIFSVFGEELVFQPNIKGERNEEIDLIFCLGETIYICELKCSVVPIESLDFSNNRAILVGAVEQVQRKVGSVVRNLNAFKAQLKKKGFSVSDGAVVAPLVITNNLINSGYPIDGVPVVDLPILARYLEGSLTELSYDAGLKPIIVRRFYESEAAAQENFNEYLFNPPQLRHIKRGIRTRDLEVPIQLFDKSMPRMRLRTYEVFIDVEDVKKDLPADMVESF